MTDPSVPPPDPLWRPEPPLPDPVLQPPRPMPWDRPWQPSEPAPPPAGKTQPQRARPEPARTRTTVPSARTAPTQRSGPPAPTPLPPVPNRPARGKPRIGLIVGVIAVVLFCGASGILNAIGGLLGQLGGSGTSTPTGPGQPAAPRSPGPVLTEATRTVEGGPETSFDLPIGTAVRFADEDGEWTVAVLGTEQVEECADLLAGTGRALVVAVRVEVLSGGVSVNPLIDFRYVDPDGATSLPTLLSTCGGPPLDFAILTAGAVRTGRVVFEGSGAGGQLTYGQLGEPTASWTVAAR